MTQLLERDDEVRSLAHAVDEAARSRGRCIWVEGAPGIGKTSLVGAAVSLARRRGVRVLTAQGGELERDFPLGVVRQLFEDVVGGLDAAARDRLFTGAAALAAPALGYPPPERHGRRPPDPSSAALHGLYRLSVKLAADGPLLLAVDDVHWADPTSLRFLAYLARRVETVPLALVLAVRDGDHGDAHSALAELRASGRATVLSPRALTERAVGRLLMEISGGEPSPEVRTAVHRATGGNAFLVHALGAALVSAGVPLDDPEAPEEIAALAPRTVWRSIAVRLSRLHPEAGSVLRAVSVLGEHAQPAYVGLLAGVDREDVSVAAGQLVRAGLLSDGLPLTFTHAILRSSVYNEMVAPERAQWHARAADVLGQAGAELDAVAGQLLLSAPAGDQAAVAALRDAARAAFARGAAETAVTYLRRALSEPVDRSERAGLLHELGRAETVVRDPAAIQHLSDACAAAADTAEHARYAHDLAAVLSYDGRWSEVYELVRRAIAELDDRDEGLRLRLAALQVALTHQPRYTEEFDSQLPEVLALIETDAGEARALRLYLALALSVRGYDCDRVPGLVKAGWDNGTFLRDEGSEALGAAYAVHSLVHVDRLAQARTIAESVIDDARLRGSVVGFVNGIGTRAFCHLRHGALAEAEADARRSIELAQEHGLWLIEPYVTAYLAVTLLELERLDEAAALVSEASVPEHFSEMAGWATLLDARARVRLAQHDVSAAIADLRQAAKIWQACAVRNPNVSSWRSELALLLAGQDPVAARSLVEDELSDARQAGSHRAIGLALRARGAMAGRDGVADLLHAVSELEQSPAVLEHARARCELGRSLMRVNRRSDAREQLQRARELAHQCGASALAARAEGELRAIGSRPRRLAATGRDALTPSQRQVALLAAGGLTNREIAQQLFVTVNTVESHLRGAFLKLGISSRKQLRSAFDDP